MLEFDCAVGSQGGDPTGTGKGGQSIWGTDFPDEIVDSLKFNSRGVLAMATKVKNSNRSQFFITYGKAPHINGTRPLFSPLLWADV